MVTYHIYLQQQPVNDINVDDVLKGLSAVEGANGFVIFN